jgi:hypothetical protein
MTGSANLRYRLAPRTSSLRCVQSMRQGVQTTLTGIPQRLDRRRLMQLFTSFHHHRR